MSFLSFRSLFLTAGRLSYLTFFYFQVLRAIFCIAFRPCFASNNVSFPKRAGQYSDSFSAFKSSNVGFANFLPGKIQPLILQYIVAFSRTFSRIRFHSSYPERFFFVLLSARSLPIPTRDTRLSGPVPKRVEWSRT